LRIVLLQCQKQLVDPRFDLELAVETLSLRGRCEELHLLRLTLVLDLAEDQLEELPKSFRLLQSLVAGDVVVAASEGEEKSVARGGFQLLEPRSLHVLLGLPEGRNVWKLHEPDLAADDRLAVAIPLETVGPHAVFGVRTRGKVALQLANAIPAVVGLDGRGLALDDDVRELLAVWLVLSKDDQIGARFAGAESQGELDRDVRPWVAILAHKRLRDLLPYVLFRALLALGCLVDEVEELPLLDDDSSSAFNADQSLDPR
jgi:hypothetical protein